MSVLSEQNVAVLFTTSDPETGAATDADALPVGTLHRNGEATEDVVQITKAQTGLYKVAVSLPECDPGDMLSISVSATVGGVAASAVVWEDTVQVAVPVASVGADAIDYASFDVTGIDRVWGFLVADETPASVVMHVLNIVAPRLLSMIEADDVDWRFTEGALAEAPTGGGGATAQDVWEYATRALTDKAGFSLATAPPTASAVAGEVRTELATELAHIDADISSRMATFTYAAPDNTGIAAASALAAKLETMLEADGADYAYTEGALANAPSTGGGGGATAAEVWTYGSRALTDKTGYALAPGHGLALDDTVAKDATVAKAATVGTPLQAGSYAAPPSASDNATAVWTATERTLSSFGTLVADVATAVWAAATRTLSAFSFTPTPSNASDTAAIKERTDRLPDVPAAKADADAATSAANAAKDSADLANRIAPDNAGIAANGLAIGALNDLGPGDVTGAVWDAAMAGHTDLGTTGARLNSAAAAGDPWTAVLPGEYDEGTAGALLPQLAGALAALGAHDVTVVSPVSECGAVLIHAGDDYKAADGRGVVFTVADAGHLLRLDEAGALLRFKCRQGTWTATMVASTPAGYTVTFEPTRVQTAVLTGAQPYELEATQADGDVITLAVGRLEVARDIPTLPS